MENDLRLKLRQKRTIPLTPVIIERTLYTIIYFDVLIKKIGRHEGEGSQT